MNGIPVKLAAALTAIMVTASCSVHHDRFTSRGDVVEVSCLSVSVRSDKVGTSIDLTNINITPKSGRKACEVKICIEADTNGNGTIEDSERKCIYDKSGSFVGFSKQRISFKVNEQIESAKLVIEARDCDRLLDEPDRHVISIDRDGMHRLDRDRPYSVTFAAGRARTHYVEVLPTGGGSAQLTIGDVRSRGGVLTGLGRKGAPDFMAALVFIDDALLTVLTGPGPASISIPKVSSPIGKVRIVTFDRAFTRCADIELLGSRLRL